MSFLNEYRESAARNTTQQQGIASVMRQPARIAAHVKLDTMQFSARYSIIRQNEGRQRNTLTRRAAGSLEQTVARLRCQNPICRDGVVVVDGRRLAVG